MRKTMRAMLLIFLTGVAFSVYGQAQVKLPLGYCIIRHPVFKIPDWSTTANLIVAYKNAKEEYTILGKTSSAVEEVKLFLEDHGSLIYLGKIDKSGIQKADGTRLRDFGPSTGPGWRTLGLDADLLENPMGPILVYVEGGKFSESDIMALLTIDISSKTLMFYDYSKVETY